MTISQTVDILAGYDGGQVFTFMYSDAKSGFGDRTSDYNEADVRLSIAAREGDLFVAIGRQA